MSILKREYCHLCGAKLTTVEAGAWKCTSCGQNHYTNPKPAVELGLLDSKGRILVSRRGREPHKGKFDLPGGFMDAGETIEQTALREVKEELNLDASDITAPEYFTSMSVPYPFQREQYQVVVLVLVARLKDSNITLQARDDVAEVVWLSEAELNVDDFATPKHFDNVKSILQGYPYKVG